MKVAVFGCGSIGRRHIKNIQNLGYDVVAWNRGEARAQNAANDFSIRTYTDQEKLLEQETPNIVFICTPNSCHIEDAILAASYNCHLFIEKPLSHTLDKISKLENIVKQKNLLVQVGANLRYDFGPATLFEYMKQRKIGRGLWAGFYGGMYLPDWHPDEDYRHMYSAKTSLGGGVVLDFIHEIDLILWFFGQPSDIMGRSYNSGALDIETDDVADMLFLYKDKNVNLHIDYLQKPFQRGIKIIGENGWCEWSLSEQRVSLYDIKTQKLETLNYPENYDKNDMYIEQLKSFFACLEVGKMPENDLVAGKNALHAALSINTH